MSESIGAKIDDLGTAMLSLINNSSDRKHLRKVTDTLSDFYIHYGIEISSELPMEAYVTNNLEILIGGVDQGAAERLDLKNNPVLLVSMASVIQEMKNFYPEDDSILAREVGNENFLSTQQRIDYAKRIKSAMETLASGRDPESKTRADLFVFRHAKRLLDVLSSSASRNFSEG